MSKRALRVGVVGLLVIAAAGGGGAWWWSHRHIESTDNAYVHGDVTAISPKVTGYVTEVAVADNAYVRKGDVLVRIDSETYAARVAEARAACAAAEAAIAGIDRRLEAQRDVIAEARAGIETWKADLTLARQDHERISSLAKKDFASRQRLDAARAAVDKARAGLDQARAKLKAAQSQIEVLRADRRQQEAVLAQAQAKLKVAEQNLEDTVVRAPASGVIGNRGVRRGQLVQPGAHLMSLVPLDTVWVDANFKETQIGAMQPGQAARIEVDAYPGVTVTGRVTSLAPASGAEFSLLPPQNATGNFTKVVQRVPVRIELPPDNPLAGKLRPGLSVVVSVDTSAAPAEAGVLARNVAELR